MWINRVYVLSNKKWGAPNHWRAPCSPSLRGNEPAAASLPLAAVRLHGSTSDLTAWDVGIDRVPGRDPCVAVLHALVVSGVCRILCARCEENHPRQKNFFHRKLPF